LYDYKGIPTVLGAAARLPHVEFHLVGGLPEDVARQRRRVEEMKLGNVILHGIKPHRDVPAYLWHSSVLLLPPLPDHPSAAWTSPVKLGEYLASGTPVVASDIPALRDWVDDREVCFVHAGDADDLARGIQLVLSNPNRAEAQVRAAGDRAKRLTYDRRAQSILERLELA
jgi:glycosyltransferase involved in cell wall biosynthesis